MGHSENERHFFLEEIKKVDHQLSETFDFIKISYVLTELWIFLYLEWCFFVKKVLFPAKTAVGVAIGYTILTKWFPDVMTVTTKLATYHTYDTNSSAVAVDGILFSHL